MIASSGNLTSTITYPELIWTVIGLLGLIISSRNLRQTILDLEALNRSGRNGILRAIALGSVREELFRVLESVVITVIGVLAMVTPPANRNAPVTTLTYVITIGLIMIILLIVIGSVSASRSRSRALQEIRGIQAQVEPVDPQGPGPRGG